MPTAAEYKAMGYSNYATKAWGDMPDLPESQRTVEDYVKGYAVPGQAPVEAALALKPTMIAGGPAEQQVIQAIVAGGNKMVYDPMSDEGAMLSPAEIIKGGYGTLRGSDLPMAQAAAPGIGAALGLLGGAGGIIGTVAGIASAGYGLLQGLGLGEGGGLFGNNLLGGDEQVVGGVTLGGPGLPEPSASMIIKEWHVNYSWGRLQYYLVQMPSGSRKILLYNTRTQRWKAWTWRAPRLAVIGKNMPKHKMLVRLRKNLSKHTVDAKSLLRLTSPNTLRAPKRRRR